MKTWQIVLIVILIFAIAFAAVFFWGKSIWDKITFGMPRLLGLNLNGLTLSDFGSIATSGTSKEVTATVAMDIKNGNSFSIPFSSLAVKFYYKDNEIAETSDMLSTTKQIPANGTFTGTDTVKIILNGSGIQMLIDKLTTKKVTLEYRINVKIFGIPLPKAFQLQTVEL